MKMRTWMMLLAAAAPMGCAPEADDSAEQAEALDQSARPELAAIAVAGNLPGETLRYFDGIDDQITVPDHAAYDFGTSDFTIETRVKLLPHGFIVPLVYKRTLSTGFAFLTYGNQLLLQMNGRNYTSQVLPDLVDGSFHQLAVRRAAGQITFFLDGRPVGTADSNIQVTAAAGPLLIGRDAINGVSLRGSVREVRLFRAGLSDATLAALSAPSSTVSDGSLVGSWNGNRVSLRTAVDSSPTANDGFLGTQLESDGADPSVSNLIPTFTPTSFLQARLAGSNGTTEAEGCGEILVDGTFDTIVTSTSSDFTQTTADWMCDESKFDKAVTKSGSVGLTIPIEGIPVKFAGDWKNSESAMQWRKFCSAKYQNTTSAIAEHMLYQVASPVIVNAWLECKRIKSQVLQITHQLSADGQVVTLGARSDTVVREQVPNTVYGFYVVNATCASPFVVGTEIPQGGGYTTALCTRTGNGPVTAVLSTYYGSRVWTLPATTGADAWITGAQPEWGTPAERCKPFQTSKYNCPAVRFPRPNCKDHNGRTWSEEWHVDANTERASEAWLKNSNWDYVQDKGAGVDGTRVWGKILVYRQSEVSWEVCAKVATLGSKEFTSPTASVDVSLPFTVKVPANTTNAVMHVKDIHGSERVVQLDSPGSVAQVTVANDGTHKHYTVTMR